MLSDLHYTFVIFILKLTNWVILAEVVKGGKIVVHGIISGIPVPFPLPDNNLCHFLKSGCDAQPNVPTEMDYSLYVKETYPSVGKIVNLFHSCQIAKWFIAIFFDSLIYLCIFKHVC